MSLYAGRVLETVISEIRQQALWHFVPVQQVIEDVDGRWNAGAFGCHANPHSRSITVRFVVGHVVQIAIIEVLWFVIHLPSLAPCIRFGRCIRTRGVGVSRLPFCWSSLSVFEKIEFGWELRVLCY